MIKKKNPNAPVTNQTLGEAVDAILGGVDKMFKEERIFNTNTFATKEDLKTKINYVRQDINGLRAEISTSPTGEEFNRFKIKLDKYATA